MTVCYIKAEFAKFHVHSSSFNFGEKGKRRSRTSGDVRFKGWFRASG